MRPPSSYSFFLPSVEALNLEAHANEYNDDEDVAEDSTAALIVAPADAAQQSQIFVGRQGFQRIGQGTRGRTIRAFNS